MTGVVKPGSDLERRKWIREGLVQAASKSFWNGMTGTSPSSIVFQAKNESAKEGHTVVFDYDGNASGKAIKGKNTAFGKGEAKRKFSSNITVERYRLVVDNGDKFDGVNIGDLQINEHSHSRTLLGDLFTRFKDQSIFDAAQGNLITLQGTRQSPSHTIEFESFGYDELVDIEKTLRTSQGYTTGGVRRPLVPFNLNEQDPMWLVVLDASVVAKLRKDPRWTSLMPMADVRGDGNRVIKGDVRRLGRLMVMEAPQFFGATAGDLGTGFGLDDSEIEIAGLRQIDKTNDALTGQEGFDYASSQLYSRCLILGAGGLQIAFGKQPDYKVQYSEDFGIKSESCLEVWMEVQKTILKEETGPKYKQAQVAGIDHGVVALDIKVS